MAMRMPSDALEVKFCPDRGATIFNDARTTEFLSNPNTLSNHILQNNGIVVCWSGLQANTVDTIRVEITTVYEWKPAGNINGQAVVNDDERGAYRPGVTLDTILNTIKKVDWYYWGTAAQNLYGMMANMYISTPQRRIAGPIMRGY
jgi:hypothetical protein